LANEESLAAKLIHAARLCRTLHADLLDGLGLHPGQDTLLNALAEQDGRPMGSLAGALGVRAPTVSKMVARMEGQGLVRRQGSAEDSRRSFVFITDAGAALVGRIGEAWAQAETIAFARFSDKDRRRLRKLLKKVRAAIGPEGGAARPARKPR